MGFSKISTTRGYWFCSSADPPSLPQHRRHSQCVEFSLSISPCRKTRPLLCRIGLVVPHKQNHFKVLSYQSEETPLLEARFIEEIYEDLAERLLARAAMASNPDWKYIVGLAGPPGAGKSTVASEVVKRINLLWPQKSAAMESLDVAISLPMDGFHFYRYQLDAMENPEEAHARRGASWTFDPARLLTCLKALRSQGSVYAPSFDHGVGDPVEDDIFVSPQHKVVIVEGNYLLLEEGIWKEVSSMFDEKWFIEVDIDTAMQRVLKRHISTGKPPDVAKWRIEYNDRPNAELINESKKKADLIISFGMLEIETSYRGTWVFDNNVAVVSASKFSLQQLLKPQDQDMVLR